MAAVTDSQPQAEAALPASPTAEFAFSPQASSPPSPLLMPGSAGSRPASPVRTSMSPSDSRVVKAANRRQLAAEWISVLTGASVPHDSDAAFRSSLRDGVTLCRLLNALRPGTVGKILDYSQECSSPTGEVIKSFENVTNFIRGCQALIGQDASVCSADFEDMSLDERPAVADCVLALHAWWQGQQAGAASPWPAAQRSGSATPTSGSQALPSWPPSSTPSQPSQPSPQQHGQPDFSFTPYAATAVNRAAGQKCNDGLEFLMRTCNHMLKSSMGMPATPLPPPPRAGGGVPPEIALDAVGPVLETVLQNLTAEYEKRLLAKDQEFKLSCEAQERMRRDIARLRHEVTHWKEQAAAVKYLPAPDNEMSAVEREAYERQLAEKEAAAAAEVARKEAELRSVQQAAAAQVAEAETQLEELSQEVQQYRDLNERYRVVSEENRQLYNTVQDLRGNIRVFCRVRPRGRTGDGTACMVELGEEGMLNVFSQKHNKWHAFKFDSVFGEDSSQDDVYAETQPLIRSVLDGYNVCIFAYGQTGSGKTHTMSGTDIGEYANRGINYRALDDLFELTRQRAAEVEYSINVQLLEIYNESVRDLLVSDAEARQQRSLQLVNTKGSGANVPDAKQVPVGCTEDVLEVMDRGARNRAVAETKMNNRSSRSHQVLTVMVEGTNRVTHARTHGCLHLIDLAGSERVGRSGAEGQQLLEAQHINRSLSALGTVMHALASKAPHVPFRDSKLTQLLQDSLSGQAKTMMFMHVAPEVTSVSETLSTLIFGRNVTEITLGAAKKNAESGAAWEAKERAMRSEREAAAARSALAAEQERAAALETELESLRAQLAHAASSACETSEDEASIRAYRPAATRHTRGATAPPGSGQTPRSRLSLPAAPARGTPAGASAAGARGLTPRSATPASGATPLNSLVGVRPQQVSRLNLGSDARAPASEGRPLRATGVAGASRPPMSKLNLSKITLVRSEVEENKTPLPAAVSLVVAPGSGATTPRGGAITTPRGSTSWLTEGSESERDSPSDAAGGPGPAEEAGQEVESFELAVSPPRPNVSGSAARQQAAAAPAAVARSAGQLPKMSLPLGRLAQQRRASTGVESKLTQAPLSSRIPAPSPPTAAPAPGLSRGSSGSLTARPSLRSAPSPGITPGSLRAPLSARESAADAAARRATLKAASASSRFLGGTSMQRGASGTSEVASNGSLGSTRGARSSQVAVGAARRWA